MRFPWALSLSCLVAACHGAPPAPRPTVTSASELEGSASFASLVGRLDAIANEPGRSVEPCVVRRAAPFPRLVADLAPAITPMPDATESSVDAALRADTVRLVSRYGLDGSGGPFVASFTFHPPPEDGFAIVVVVGRDAVFVRSTTATGPRDDGIAPARAAERIAAAIGSVVPVVVVTAAPDVPLADVLRMLEALADVRAPIALGVLFDGDHDLRDPREAPESTTGVCASLPPVEAGTQVGALDPTLVHRALAPLDASIGRCMEASHSVRVARGGRLRLAARIDARGRTVEACALADSIGDATFRACALEATRSLAWPEPNPSGVVDVVFPIRVRIAHDADHRAVCGEDD